MAIIEPPQKYMCQVLIYSFSLAGVVTDEVTSSKLLYNTIENLKWKAL